MEEKKSQRTLWITVAVIVGLLLSCCIGVSLGGMVGYAAGVRSGARSPLNPVLPRQTAIPELPWSREPMQPRSPTGGVGAVVVEVTPGSPAESAGIRQGDIILAVNGQGLSSETNLAKRVSAFSPGDKATLLILRQGRQRTVTVTVGRNPDRDGSVPWLGVRYQEMPLSDLGQWGGSNAD
jgi:membrane-associated protease RseP (regulator of RpoE activity)